MFLKGYKIYLISAVSAVGISCLYNFVFLFNLYELFQTTSFIEFTTNENIKLMHALAWIFSVFVVVYCVILFNYSWKDSFIRRNFKGWNKQSVNITTNIFLYLLLSLLAYILFRSLPHNVEVYSIVFFLGKFIFAEISALIIVSLLIADRTLKRNKEVMVQLQIENKKAELQGLKEQISPHFLFNTLNTLISVIRTEEKSESIVFVENLSSVYRYLLDNQSLDTVKLGDELSFVKSYLYLLKKRFGDDLKININISSEIENNSVPPFALQMLIENAIKHNVHTDNHPLEIKIEQIGTHIRVENNLNPKPVTESLGIGLVNLSKRFKLIAGKEINITKSDLSFSVSIPFISQ
jgi:sensor histidine kinase YesM